MDRMKAMVLHKITSLAENKEPLQVASLPFPEPAANEVLIKVTVCGVCHTELDEIEGRTPPTAFPRVLGHQVVGNIVKLGPETTTLKVGDRVGVAWIFSACGHCKFCMRGLENLCDQFKATGREVDGGYAEYMTAHERFAYPIPQVLTDAEAAPLLCAGAIGFRSVRLAALKDGQRLGLTGFGASAHLVLKMVQFLHPGMPVYVFARSEEERNFARELGAVWAGDTAESSPEKLDAIIDTTPAWKPVVEALGNLEKGGRLVINAIRKEDADLSYLQNLSYQDHLWMEKVVKSVANITGKDVSDFLDSAAQSAIRPHVQEFPLEEANKALVQLKEQKIRGAKVLRISG